MTNARLMANRLCDLLARERVAMADFLVALAEFDARKSWVELGHASLFYFLHRELGLSAGAAHYRKTAAELVQRYPEIIEPLRDGRLCLTSIVQLAKVLTPENRREIVKGIAMNDDLHGHQQRHPAEAGRDQACCQRQRRYEGRCGLHHECDRKCCFAGFVSTG